jgi:hypothetical protein
MGVAGSDLRGNNETADTIVRIASDEGRRRNRITTPPPMEDVVQQGPAALARSVQLVHLGIDTSLVSFLHEVGGFVQAGWTAELEKEIRVSRNRRSCGLE